MRIPPLDLQRRRFLSYAEGFLSGLDEADAANVQLKIDHSLRVLELALAITDGEHIAGDAAQLAHAAALFHDTGRFPQYARYRTFSDIDSENHARLGVRALLANGLLAGFSPRARGLLLGTVALHNRLALPAEAVDPLRTPARVVRDADKLDIMAVLLEHLVGEPDPNSVVVLNLATDPAAYTPSLLDAVLDRHNADYRSIRFTNDFKLLVVSWVYGLEYPTTARLMRRRGHLMSLMHSLPHDSGMDLLRVQVSQDLDRLCQDKA